MGFNVQDGRTDGCDEGCPVGRILGRAEGWLEGLRVGCDVGLMFESEGFADDGHADEGKDVGRHTFVGTLDDGRLDGTLDEGLAVFNVGAFVGCEDG